MSDEELSDEDKEWMDAPLGPPRRLSIASQLGAIYDHALIMARAAAFANWYAIAVHGSEMRDLDLIAVPWTDEATDAETLVAEIVRLTGGRIGHGPYARPHGRRSWPIHLNNEHTLGNFKPVLPYIDLSVMPRAADAIEARVRAESAAIPQEASLREVEATPAQEQFQRETLRTSTLMRLVQWASARYADAHVSSFDHKTQHAPGQFFDDCESCWFRSVAADLRSRDTDMVLVEVSVTLDRGPGLLGAALDRLDTQEAEA